MNIINVMLGTKTTNKQQTNITLHRGSYMSAHVLLNLLNKLGKKIRCEAMHNILSVFPNEFNNFSNTGAGLQNFIYHMTLKSHFISEFCTKTARFRL